LISPITFGNKIPCAKCQIRDIRQNKNVEATLVEFDCKDLSDIDEMAKLNSDWTYKEDVISNMIDLYQIHQMKVPKKSPMAFFALENDNGEIIGFSQIKKENPEIVLNFLESEKNGRYKYIGQNIISCLCSLADSEYFKRICIPAPTSSAFNFYTKKCGFRKLYGDCALVMGKFKMNLFQKRLEKRLKSN